MFDFSTITVGFQQLAIDRYYFHPNKNERLPSPDYFYYPFQLGKGGYSVIRLFSEFRLYYAQHRVRVAP